MEQYEENASGDTVKMPESFELVLNLKVMSASICPLLENVADVYSGNLKLPLQICRPLLQPNPQLLLTSKILAVMSTRCQLAAAGQVGCALEIVRLQGKMDHKQ